MRVRAGTLLVLAAIAVAAAPAPAAALCASGSANPMLNDDPGQVVFVGTAVAVAGVHNALFEVEEVWRGGPLPEWLVIRGTESALTLNADLPSWERGTRYLVEAYRRGAGVWTLVCESEGSQAFGAAAMSYRPSDVQAPTHATPPLLWQGLGVDSPLWPPVLLLGLGGIVVGSFYIVTRRGRTV